MPLLKRTVTPARLAANRRAALKSTGPRTARGKARSSLNALRSGGRSKTMKLLWRIIAEALPFGVITTARQTMTAAQLSHRNVAWMLNLCLAKGDVPIKPDPGGIQFLSDYLYAGNQTKRFAERRSKPKVP